MIKGVNLGNWLVLEKWMSPKLFAGTTAEDEAQLALDLEPAMLAERLRGHRDSYITERDFAYIANHGLDAVRIPVPFFVFDDYPPYVGCIDHLDRAFDWAEAYDIDILLDLHTVPDSQNGFDNGGMSGVCKWHLNPGHVEFALTVLERLTARYAGRPAFWGIQVLNEPISSELWELADIPNRYVPHDPAYAAGSEPVPTDFLANFYVDAYRRIRAQSSDVTVVFHDGFRLGEWGDFFTTAGFEGFVVDTHLYLMMLTMSSGEQDLDGYLRHVRENFAVTIAKMSQSFPLMVGEWCLDPLSPTAAALGKDERRHFLRGVAEAQLTAWGGGAMGWFFWSYKLLLDGAASDGWDLGKAVELGYFGEALHALA